MDANMKFSSQERIIIQKIRQAKCRKTIAKELHISIHTVDTHLRHIRAKTNTHTIPELMVWAMQNNLKLSN